MTFDRLMKKTHHTYLRRIVNIAATLSGGAVVSRIIATGKTPDTPVYRMMLDIVCDARFYSVIENDIFWRNYSVWSIQNFIDSGIDNHPINDHHFLAESYSVSGFTEESGLITINKKVNSICD